MSLSDRERAEGFLLSEAKQGSEVDRRESSGVFVSNANEGSMGAKRPSEFWRSVADSTA